MKISVIIPCYNQASFLEETCKSIINQSYTNWEALIINDGSTDNTQNVALKICKDDHRFKYIHKDNGGLSSARNKGLEKASGDYIQFLDSDDLLASNKFEQSIALNKDLIISNFEMLENNLIKPPFCELNGQQFLFENILLQWDKDFSIPIHCGLFKRKLIKHNFNEKLKAKEDWFFWLNFLSEKPTISFINEPLCTYRQHVNNMCKDQSHMIEYSKTVNSLIFNSFNNETQKLFFDRINTDYTLEKHKHSWALNQFKKEKKRKKKIIFFFSFLTLLLLITNILSLLK